MFEARDPDYAARVRSSFARQAFMAHLGAELERIEPGAVDITIAMNPALTQQHGFLHAGVTISIADSAAGYAALSLMPKGAGVLTTELKVNLMNPARGETFVARGQVLKPGRTLTICRGDVFGTNETGETHIATALLTMMAVTGVSD